jgi:hypothetical protein
MFVAWVAGLSAPLFGASMVMWLPLLSSRFIYAVTAEGKIYKLSLYGIKFVYYQKGIGGVWHAGRRR